MTDQPRSARPAGYATGRATKQAIVARAAEAFAQKGFYGASLRGIAREADVDHSTLLHHFGNKAALLIAVIEWHDERSAPPDLPALENLTAEQLVDGFATVARQNQQTPGLVQLFSMLSAEAGAADHPARASLRRRHELLVEIIGGMIARRRDELSLPDDGRTQEQHAVQIVATWEGLQVYEALHPGTVDIPGAIERMLREAFGLT